MTLAWDGSGRSKVRREPEAVMICCSLVPENWPRMACVIVDGGWIVKEYRNMLEVVAILTSRSQMACAEPSWVY